MSNERDCVFCKHFKRIVKDNMSYSECELKSCNYEEISIDYEDDEIDDIAEGLFKKLKCIPECKKLGKRYYSKCSCGGKLVAIRSTYNGHLHAKCNRCGFALHE